MESKEFQDIVQQLRNVSDALGDRSMSLLREAIDSGSGVRPPQEKVLSQARRAVDKAISLLGGGSVTDD